jgi:hypothetical protein
LHSVVFSSDASSSSSSLSQGSSLSAAATGSGAGLPCGGTAGILCPGGFYCDITDVANNVGRCKKIGG